MIRNYTGSQFLSIEQVQSRYLNTTSERKATSGGLQNQAFSKILSGMENKTAETEVKFSKHATNRLSDRGIEMTDEQMQRLNKGKQQAGAKGINESLILVDQLAFIVNVPNNTVITAMDSNETEENIFTNIDGAVIA